MNGVGIKKGTLSHFIREWVATEFNDVGQFRTCDVADGLSRADMSGLGESMLKTKDSAYISAALQSWVNNEMIVNGYRLQRNTAPGKTAIWETVAVRVSKDEATITKAPKAVAVRSKPGGVEIYQTEFKGDVVDRRADGMLVNSGGKIFKVTPLDW